MSQAVKPVRIEELQARSKGSEVVRIKRGFEKTAATVAKSSGADTLQFRQGDDQMILAGRGLDLKGLREGTPVQYQGRAGQVSAKPLNPINTFSEGVKRPLSVLSLFYGIGGGAVLGLTAGAVVAALGYFMGGGGAIPWAQLALGGAGLGIVPGVIFMLLFGARAASKRVELKAFDEIRATR